MNIVKIKFMYLDEAARALVAAAPARADYYGIEMRAKYATTRPADVVAQYRRTVRGRAWSYGARLPKKQRDALMCACGATNCKMWREYNTSANHTKILCGTCALADQKKVGPIDVDGKIETDLGKCDQIGWPVPAVPDVEGLGFWGYTSVPADACEWWMTLPSYPPRMP